MSQRWVTVFSGPVWRALGVQARLEAEGFLTFVPDQNLRALDPYMTGGDVFALDVQVPEDAVEPAMSIVRLEAAGSKKLEGDRAKKKLDADSALRLGWWTIFVAPVGFVLGLLYLWRVHKTGVRPEGHGFNLFTVAGAALLTVAFVCMLFARLQH